MPATDFRRFVRWGDSSSIDASAPAVTAAVVPSKGQQASAKEDRPRSWTALVVADPQGFVAGDVWSLGVVFQIGVGSASARVVVTLASTPATLNSNAFQSVQFPAESIEAKGTLTYTSVGGGPVAGRAMKVSVMVAPLYDGSEG